MILRCGITELVGDHSVGKTSFALYLARNKRSLYISSSLLRHKTIPKSVLIARFESFIELKTYICRSLPGTVSLFAIECIIIDGFDEFLFSEHRPRSMIDKILKMIKVLRDLCFTSHVTVIITNNYSTYWRVSECTVFNRFLGLGWCYVANCRYLIEKINDAKRKITCILGQDDFSCTFVIEHGGVKLTDSGG